MDPIEIGVRLHGHFMEMIAKHVTSQDDLRKIARAIDAFAGAIQVRTAERGLDGPVDAIRQVVKEKLQSLGLIPEKETPPEPLPVEFASESPCFCQKDDDGQCVSCRQMLATFGTEFAEVQRTYMERIDKIGGLNERVSCVACGLKYTDLVLAGVFANIGEAIPSDQQNVALAMYTSFYQLIMSKGIEATPMLDKAWAELKVKRDWA